MNENKEEIISGSAISRLVLAHKYKRKEIFNYEECSFILNKLIENDKEIDRLNNIIKNLDKMFEYYFLGNLKYDQDTVNTIYIKYVKLKELKGELNE